LHPDDREQIRAEFAAARARNEPFRGEYRLLGKDGREIWVRDQARVVQEAPDEPAYLLGVLVDITERRRADEALYRREQEFRAVVETAPDVIARIGPDLRYVWANPAMERALGAPAGALLGTLTGERWMSPRMAAAWRLTLEQVFATRREQTVELTVTLPVGERTYQVRAAPELGPDGSVASVVAVARDHTERTRRDEEQAQLYRELLEREARLSALVRRALLSSEEERRRRQGLEELAQLTRREREVLRLLAQGLTTKEIAGRLVLGSGTVKGHIGAILDKLGVANRTQAAVRAGQLGLMEDERA
jgi:PAS domain S-box-containing protein